MHARVALIVLLAALASAPAQAAPPADAFCVILIEGLDDFRLVRVLVDEETNVSEREQLFPVVDTDADGVVTRDEADAWRMQQVDAARHYDDLDPRLMLTAAGDVDGVNRGFIPLYHATWRQVGHTFHKQDHEQPWPVTEPIDLETQAVREYRFSADGATSVVLRGGQAPATSSSTTTSAHGSPTQGSSTSATTTVTIEYVVVRAPAGWRVAHVEGHTYDGWFQKDYDAPQREVDLPAFDTKSSWQVRFERAPTGDATLTATGTTTTPTEDGQDDDLTVPGAGILVAFLLLVLAARRRL